jgi:mono/diheme cytochrome c family protein
MRALIALSLLLAGAVGAAEAAEPSGKAVFDQWCAGCHAPLETKLGFGPPAGTYTLGQRYKNAKPAALEQRSDLASAYVKLMVRNGAGMMPQTRKTEISDAELEALARYLAKNNP